MPAITGFDRAAFEEDVKSARQTSRADLDQNDYAFSQGLRLLIETIEPLGPGGVAELLQARIHPEFTVERLFDQEPRAPQGEQSARFPLPDNMDNIYLARLGGLRIEALDENPFDIAYELAKDYRIKRVDIDIPYVGFEETLTSGPPGRPPTRPALDAKRDHAWSLREVKAPQAWAVPPRHGGAANGEGVQLGHLDTGWTHHVDFDPAYRAPDLNYLPPGGDAYDPLDYPGNAGHGTKTGSVIMSQGDVETPLTSIGVTPPGKVTGVARSCTYRAIRCIESVVIIYGGDVARALHGAALNNCHVASLSLGGFPSFALHKALQFAVAHNMLVICAAGNQAKLVVWPARYDEALAIAATNIDKQPWKGSCRGPAVDVAAPGERVWEAEPLPGNTQPSPGRDVAMGDGTSYATATTAGVAALWYAHHGVTNLQAYAIAEDMPLQYIFAALLERSANAPMGWDFRNYGAGIVDARLLLLQPLGEHQRGRRRKKSPTRFWHSRDPYRYEKKLMRALTGDRQAAASLIDRYGQEIATLALLERLNFDTSQKAVGHVGNLSLTPKRRQRLLRRIYDCSSRALAGELKRYMGYAL